MSHGVPTAAELAEAVREFLERDVRPATSGRVAFHARVAANVLAMLERELRLAPADDRAHARRLARLGVADNAELAAAIRAGSLAGRLDEVVDVLRRQTTERVRIVNPRHLTTGDRDARETEET